MIIVGVAVSRNDADVVFEVVSDALRWLDHFVLVDFGSSDQTVDIARAAGAMVIEAGEGRLPHDSNYTSLFDAAMGLGADWLVRFDMGCFYPDPPDPRGVIESAHAAGASCVMARQVEFWPSIADVRSGLLWEDERVSVRLRRQWYSVSDRPALAAWSTKKDLPMSDPYGWGKDDPASLLTKTVYRFRGIRQFSTIGREDGVNVIDEAAAGLRRLGDGGLDLSPCGDAARWLAESNALLGERLGYLQQQGGVFA